MIRETTLSAALLAMPTASLGCNPPLGPIFETSNSLPADDRATEGVAFDNDGPLPSAKATAHTNDVVVTIKEPFDRNQALRAIRVFFRAIRSEDSNLMATVLAESAEAVSADSGARTQLKRHWSRRFDRFDYQTLEADPPYRESMVEIYGYGETVLPGRSELPRYMRAGDVFVRVPVTRVFQGYDRLFGDEIGFLLRRNGKRLEILETHEGFENM